MAAERSHALLCSHPSALRTDVDAEGTFVKAQAPSPIRERSRATVVATRAKGVSTGRAEKRQIRRTSPRDGRPHSSAHECQRTILLTLFACQMNPLVSVVLRVLSAVTGWGQAFSCLPGS